MITFPCNCIAITLHFVPFPLVLGFADCHVLFSNNGYIYITLYIYLTLQSPCFLSIYFTEYSLF